MEAKLVEGKIVHKRFLPVTHAFSYSVPYFLVKLPDLLVLDQKLNLFSFNKCNLYSIFSKDYLTLGEESLEEKFFKLSQQTSRSEPWHVWLLTCPRFLNYVFNPITFYFVETERGKIDYVLVEVTNTYHEKHLYHLHDEGNVLYLTNRQQKVFHVSPFFKEEGEYKFRISKNLDNLEIHITYYKEGRAYFYANLLQNQVFPVLDRCLLHVTIFSKSSILRTMLRILKEAFLLHFYKKLPAYRKPIPVHPNTIRPKPPTWIEDQAMRAVFSRLKRFDRGALLIELPDGSRHQFGQKDVMAYEIKVKEYSFFKRLVWQGEIGLGESYVQGLWESEQLTDVLAIFAKNKHKISSATKGKMWSRFLQLLRHVNRRNTLGKSQKNIQEHYDLGNEFYALFLDKNLNYSSALYNLPTDTLEMAQNQKLDRLFSQLRIRHYHHVLEIGSGWGAAAIWLVQTTGCHVTTLTLSQEQFSFVTHKINVLGLSDKIRVLLQDYRLHKGDYDRVFSIEMIEAVGHAFLSNYFKVLDTLLKPNGLVAIQMITLPDQRYRHYRLRSDWIQKHIFPGGHLPSLQHVQNILANDTAFIIEDIKNLTSSYAKTLAEWKKRFLKDKQKIYDLGFDEAFIRKWGYYLSYCEAGFSSRYINVLQLLMTRPTNSDLSSF